VQINSATFSFFRVARWLDFTNFITEKKSQQSNEPIFSLKISLETRLSSESLEPLIGFLAYLEPKLWIKNQKKSC